MAKAIFGNHSSVLSSSGMVHDYDRFRSTRRGQFEQHFKDTKYKKAKKR